MAPVDSRNYVFWSGGTRFFISKGYSPARLGTPEASLCQDLLPGRWSTVTKLFLGSISGATDLISSHPAMCKTQCRTSSAGSEYKPSPIQCLLNIGPAPVLASIHSTLGLLSRPISCWLYYRHDALNQSWVNVGLPSVTLAHIQRGAKHDTVTRYWAMLGQRRRQWADISQHWVHLSCLTACPLTDRDSCMHRRHEQPQINQHVSTSIEPWLIMENSTLSLLRLHL